MKFTYTTALAALLIAASGTFFTSCGPNEENEQSAVMEKMQFEGHFSHSLNLYENGNSSFFRLKSEYGSMAAMSGSNSMRSNIIKMTVDKMEEINVLATDIIRFIHSEKKKIVNTLGCPSALEKFDSNYPHPAFLDGSVLSGDQEEYLNSKDLEIRIIKYRNALVELTANSWVRRNSEQPTYDAPFNTKLLKKLPSRSDKCDVKNLRSILSEVYVDDMEGLIDLIIRITPKSGEDKDYTAREALHYLCIQEARILAARKTAFGLFKQRISTSGSNYDKIIPLAYGPDAVSQGDEVQLQVMIAAYNSYDNPVVTCDRDAVIEIREGIAYINMNVDQTTTVRGTIGTRNKTGQLINREWEKIITVK